ncbi:hypothetical protein LCGC14_0775620 [marine sediment metagenome]|uniref:Uncharacterized protein n=1 Tax=marine sediment metagenome TaxID=412755 RepID=A0A0F9QGV1_9ZZZZ
MGKGTVESHIADGEYEVQLKYDRETFDRRIAQLNTKITDFDTRITDIEDALEYAGF